MAQPEQQQTLAELGYRRAMSEYTNRALAERLLAYLPNLVLTGCRPLVEFAKQLC